jgi:DNA-binding transcriptional LysR family regulator
MEFRQIQYFACLFEEGSVTRAARRLCIVQPALSMQIGKLEAEIGQKLFERSTQGMVPTALGAQMYRLFQPILQDFAHASEQILENQDELSGHVKVGVIGSIAQGVLPDAITAFHADNPKVSVSVSEGYSNSLADAVLGGQIDAAIINNPRRAMPLSIEPIVEEELLLLTGPDGAIALPKRITLAAISEMKLILPTRQHGLRALLENFAASENLPLEPVLESDTLPAIIDLVEQGGFATILPHVAVRASLEKGRLIGHSVAKPRLSRLVVTATNPRRALTPATAAFVAMLVQRIRALGETRLPQDAA